VTRVRNRCVRGTAQSSPHRHRPAGEAATRRPTFRSRACPTLHPRLTCAPQRHARLSWSDAILDSARHRVVSPRSGRSRVPFGEQIQRSCEAPSAEHRRPLAERRHWTGFVQFLTEQSHSLLLCAKLGKAAMRTKHTAAQTGALDRATGWVAASRHDGMPTAAAQDAAEASRRPAAATAMMHLRCPTCRLRVPRTFGRDEALCPGCESPLEACTARDVVGYRLWAATGLPWAASDLAAVAQAVTRVAPTPGRSP
jgi:hypothetical protein